METRSEPKLREAAVARFDEEWAKAIAQADELRQTFERLVAAMAGMADYGSHMTLVFEQILTQNWWAVFKESGGDMQLPRNPALPPKLMPMEDQLIATITGGNP